jgi:nucleoside-diphosphate-sugar epimerase
MQKVLITGSSGFIGQHLIPHLLSKFSIYSLVSDLRDHAAVKAEVEAAQPDLIIHLAARTEVEQSFYEQTTFADINFTGTINLIEAAAQVNSHPKIIFASTMEVFGWQPISDSIRRGIIPKEIPVFGKDTNPNPNAPYAVAKFGCEKYLEYAHRVYGLEYMIFRQTNSYGRTDNKFFVTEQIITQMLSGNSCNLGYAEPYRNFLYISDLINAYKSAIDCFDNISNQTYTLGPNNALSIRDYAKMIAKKLRWNGNINWDTKLVRPGEIYLLNSDHVEFTRDTGWTPSVDLNDGIDLTISTWKK